MENPTATKEDLEWPTKELNDVMMKIGQKLHQAWANQAGAQANQAENKSDDWVVDAEDADEKK
jgi:hypothetical protein